MKQMEKDLAVAQKEAKKAKNELDKIDKTAQENKKLALNIRLMEAKTNRKKVTQAAELAEQKKATELELLEKKQENAKNKTIASVEAFVDLDLFTDDDNDRFAAPPATSLKDSS